MTGLVGLVAGRLSESDSKFRRPSAAGGRRQETGVDTRALENWDQWNAWMTSDCRPWAVIGRVWLLSFGGCGAIPGGMRRTLTDVQATETEMQARKKRESAAGKAHLLNLVDEAVIAFGSLGMRRRTRDEREQERPAEGCTKGLGGWLGTYCIVPPSIPPVR